MKKLCALFISLCLVLTLSGCSMHTGGVDSLLTPPRPAGELAKVQLALEKSVNENFTLKYPTDGVYRSAIILKDLNSDGIEEAIALYSTTTDNTTNMHINLISKTDNENWESSGIIKVVAAGVERVDFADMNADGISEIIVGWNIYEAVDKSVGVYSITEKGLVSRILEKYTKYLFGDLNSDGKTDLLTLYKNKEKSTATAKLLGLSSLGAEEIGSCGLDPAVAAYKEPLIFKIGKKTAVYIDAVKGAGMITEMLIISDGTLTNLSLTSENTTGFNTLRHGATPAQDINGDGNYEIPISFLLTQSENSQSDNIYKTNWYCYNGKSVALTLSAIMNYSEGYYLEIPEKWDSSITVVNNSAEKTRTVFRLDKTTNSSAEELVKIQAIEKKGGALTSTYEGSFKIGESESFTYFAALGDYKGAEAITKKELSQLFKIIK